MSYTYNYEDRKALEDLRKQNWTDGWVNSARYEVLLKSHVEANRRIDEVELLLAQARQDQIQLRNRLRSIETLAGAALTGQADMVAR